MSEPSPYIQANLEAKVTQLMEVCVEKDWTIQGLNRTIDEQKQLVDVLRRIEHAFGCKHVDNGPEDANNIVRHVLELVAENGRLKADGFEKAKALVAERYRQLAALAALQSEFLKLLRLLNRVPHHGPQGSSFLPLPPPGCWSDCVACEYEEFKAMPTV